MLATTRHISLRHRAEQISEVSSLLLSLVAIIIASSALAKKEEENLAGILLAFALIKMMGVGTRALIKFYGADTCFATEDGNSGYYFYRITKLARPIISIFLALYLSFAKTNDALQAITKVMLAEAALTFLKQLIEMLLYKMLLDRPMQGRVGLEEPLMDAVAIRDNTTPTEAAVNNVLLGRGWRELILLIWLNYPLIGINPKFRRERPVLHRAVANQNTDLVKVLLELGANPDQTDVRRWTPLQYALALRNKDLVKLLAARTDLTLRDYILTLILPADRIRGGMEEDYELAPAAHITIDEVARVEAMTAAFIALRANGAPFDMRNANTILRILTHGDESTINVLVALFGSDIFNGNFFDAHGNTTVLHIVADIEMPNIRVMRALLDLELPPEALNAQHRTALDILVTRMSHLRTIPRDERGQQQIRDVDAMIGHLRGLMNWRRRRAPISAMAFGWTASEASAPESGAAGVGL